MFLKPFKNLAARILSGLKTLGYALWFYALIKNCCSIFNHYIKKPVPMATHSFSVPTVDFKMLVIWAWKMLNKATTRAKIFICLLDHACGESLANIKMECQKAVKIWEVWNLVCCYGNKTFMLVLWIPFGKMLPQRIKHFW